MTFQNLKSIETGMFSDSICFVFFPACSEMALEMVDLYNHTLRDNLENCAPEKSHQLTSHSSSPWFTDLLHEKKSLGRKLERRWRKSGLTVHLQSFKEHQSAYSAARKVARSSSYATLIVAIITRGIFFSPINRLLKPSHSSSFILTDRL